jgi:hypothetical protein
MISGQRQFGHLSWAKYLSVPARCRHDPGGGEQQYVRCRDRPDERANAELAEVYDRDTLRPEVVGTKAARSCSVRVGVRPSRNGSKLESSPAAPSPRPFRRRSEGTWCGGTRPRQSRPDRLAQNLVRDLPCLDMAARVKLKFDHGTSFH